MRKLRRHFRGAVRSDASTLNRYSRDESILCLRPAAVAFPLDADDVAVALSVARDTGVPVTARGGGTGVAGQSIGEGLVMDFAASMNAVLDLSSEMAVVQPGVVLDVLNAQLSSFGRRFLPDPSSHDRCTIGGMVMTNASGAKSFRFGSTREHVIDMSVVLSDGTKARTSSLCGRFPSLCIVDPRARRWMESRRLRTRKNSSGYDLSALSIDPPDFTRLIVGSEGTLALVTEIEVRIFPLPTTRTTAVMAYSSLIEAVEAVSGLRAEGPVSIELVDDVILDAMARIDASLLDEYGLRDAGASLWVEWEDLQPKLRPGSSLKIIRTEEERKRLCGLRSKASEVLHEVEGSRRPLRCIEDGVVPENSLVVYVQALKDLLSAHDCDGAVFGHVGDAHLHVNPLIDVRKPDLEGRIERLMDDVHRLILSFGGSISGEHGDGRLRRFAAADQWGEQLALFRAVKRAFDPKGVLNPDKKLPPQGPQNVTVRSISLSEISEAAISGRGS